MAGTASCKVAGALPPNSVYRVASSVICKVAGARLLDRDSVESRDHRDLVDSTVLVLFVGLAVLGLVGLRLVPVGPSFLAKLEALYLLALGFGLPHPPVLERRAARLALARQGQSLVGRRNLPGSAVGHHPRCLCARLGHQPRRRLLVLDQLDGVRQRLVVQARGAQDVPAYLHVVEAIEDDSFHDNVCERDKQGGLAGAAGCWTWHVEAAVSRYSLSSVRKRTVSSWSCLMLSNSVSSELLARERTACCLM